MHYIEEANDRDQAHHVRGEGAVAPGLLDVLLVLHLDPGVGRVGALAVLGDVVAARLRLRVHAQHPRRPQRPEHDQRAAAAPTEDRQDPQAVDACGIVLIGWHLINRKMAQFGASPGNQISLTLARNYQFCMLNMTSHICTETFIRLCTSRAWARQGSCP